VIDSDYRQFLAGKRPEVASHGVAVDPEVLPSGLYDFQRHCAAFAIEKGRAGIFLDTGLGKTSIELAFAAQGALATNGRALILAPLAVAWQIEREARKFPDLLFRAKVVRDQSEVEDGISICNYDRLGKIDPDAFGAVVLDEASIIKNFTGKTTAALMSAFHAHRFRLTATATPAPNDHMELGQQCQFLGVMPSNQMLMRWFVADQTQMGRYRLKHHGARDFWDWMAGWSRMAESPDDLGFDGSRFVLPPLDVRLHRAAMATPILTESLFAESSSATEIHDIKRQTAGARAALAAELATDAEGAVLVWCDTDYEANELRKMLPEFAEVRGSHPIEQKEETLEAFATGAIRGLITKPSICGFGLNWQHCRRMIFAGRTFSYESYYQAVRRCWRFGQTQPVTVDVIVADGEQQIADVIARKADDHKRMKREMVQAMRRSMTAADSSTKDYLPTHPGRLPAWLSNA
jgi:superfamily II DNA or RNA helicase